MKTIAISIDLQTLERIDRIRATPGPHRGRRAKALSRSAVVRQALQEYVARRQSQTREAGDRAVFAKARARVAKQAAALVEDQADL